jgi:hypothetical protein
MKHRFLPFIREHFLFTGILVLAIILRCYDLFSIPYTHDELSALVRTQYENFHDLINLGVKHLDTHPALVQVFLYYWTKIFGYSEWIVKLPFIFCGVASVYWVYKIGIRWSTKSAALIIASILACSEYTIMYSQMIRPYSSGLFFSLFLVYHWSELVFYKNYHLKHQLYFVIATSLCAYNHHFSLLTSALICISGLLFLEKKFIWRYLVLCSISVILYLPHLSIFLHQLARGGVGEWLGKPEPHFIIDYLYYILHFSKMISGLLLGFFIFGRFFGKKMKLNRPALYFSGGIFFSLYSIAYFYSISGSAVLQFSVLIFVFPFLLLFIFGWIKEQSNWSNIIIVSVLCTSLSITLIFHRKYYSVFYVSTFKQLIVDANQARKEQENTLTIIVSDEPKNRFYELHQDLLIPKSYIFVNPQDFFERDLENLLLKNAHCTRICFATNSGTPPNFRAIILDKYAQIIWQRNYYGASTLLVEKGESTEKPIASLPKNADLFNGYNPKKWTKAGYQFEQNEEWGPGFSKPVSELIKNRSDIIDVVVKLKLSDLSQNPLLVLNVQAGDSIIRFSASETLQKLVNTSDSTVTLIQSIKFIDLNDQKFDHPILNTFLWNRDKKPVIIRSFKVIHRKGNPLTYALNQDF